MKPLQIALLVVTVWLCGADLPTRYLPSKSALIAKWSKMARQPETKGIVCIACGILVDGLQIMLKENKTDAELEKFVVTTCKTLKLEADYVCDHIVNEFGDEVFFVLERVIFTPAEICGAFVDDCGNAVNPLSELWNISLPGNKPAVQSWPTVQANVATLRVLHLSDIHVDRHYAEGSEADCSADHPLYEFCCLTYPNYSAPAATVPAGHWGMPYLCDIPYRTFESAMKHISQTETLDYIIVTGDMEAHNIWDYTKDDTTANLNNISSTIRKYFPNTPIWESVGNHEGVPMDAMAFHGMEDYEKRGPQWLYTVLANNWKTYLPSDAIETVKYRASYMVRPFPGLKILSLNTVYCSMMNLYNYVNEVDPDGTLAWLIQELQDSESKGEKVHIISHIPPGENYCLKGWSHNFYDVINRFENTIAAQFYGHTHQDHFQVYYEDSNPKKRATHFNFIAPSLTTYSYNNPAYRIYTIDGLHSGSTFTVIDSDTYSTDILTANANNAEPVWVHTYSAREEYGMKDLSPASWNDLINRMETDDDLFKKYNWNYYRNGGKGTECNAGCKEDRLCHARSAKSHEKDLFCS